MREMAGLVTRCQGWTSGSSYQVASGIELSIAYDHEHTRHASRPTARILHTVARKREHAPSACPRAADVGQSKDELAYHLTAHLRMNAIYWGLTALCTMGHKDALDREEMIDYVMSCWDDEAGPCPCLSSPLRLILQHRRLRCPSGPRRAYPVHAERDSDSRHTRRARQTGRRSRRYMYVPTLRPISSLTSPRPAVIASLQQPSGVFAGDAFGEIDTRFLYIAVNALSLLGRLDAVDVAKAVAYIRQCRNFDGGYGAIAGAESHSGQGAHGCPRPSRIADLDRWQSLSAWRRSRSWTG